MHYFDLTYYNIKPALTCLEGPMQGIRISCQYPVPLYSQVLTALHLSVPRPPYLKYLFPCWRQAFETNQRGDTEQRYITPPWSFGRTSPRACKDVKYTKIRPQFFIYIRGRWLKCSFGRKFFLAPTHKIRGRARHVRNVGNWVPVLMIVSYAWKLL